MITSETEKRIADALSRHSAAMNEMYEAITYAVDELGEITYGVKVSHDFDEWEDRTVVKDEDGEIIIVDENDDIVCSLEDATADTLFDILSSIS